MLHASKPGTQPDEIAHLESSFNNSLQFYQFDNYGEPKWLKQFLNEGLFSFHFKAVSLKEGLHFAQYSTLENSDDSYLFLIGFTSNGVLLLFSLSNTILCAQFLMLFHQI